MQNPFLDRTLALSGPATDILPVTPDDVANLPSVAIALFIEGAGTLSVRTVAGETRTLNVPAHTTLQLGVTRVMATGTTATGIHAFVLAPALPILTNQELPVISGTPIIGETLSCTDGVWTGGTAPVLTHQWLRDGVVIAGATDPDYVLAAEDNGTTVSCRVTASESLASTDADALGVQAVYPAPGVIGTLADRFLTQNSGVQTFAAAGAFSGMALSYSITPAQTGVSVDATTGVVSVDTDATGVLSALALTVTVTNTGGSVATGFALNVSDLALEAETQAFAQALSTHGGVDMSLGQTAALDDFYIAAKASTWWSKIHRLYVGALHDAVAASLDLKDQSTRMTQVGSTDMAWTAGQGWSAENVDDRGLDMQVSPTATVGQNSVSVILWYHALTSDFGPDFGDNGQFYIRFVDDGSARTRLYNSANANASGLDTSAGFRLVNRMGANPIEIYGAAGTLIDTLSRSSETPTSTAVYLGAAAGFGATSDRSIMVNGFADHLTAAEALELRTALGALLEDFGLNVAPISLSNPVITGTGVIGATLAASDGSWDGDGLSFAYQWNRDGTPIAGATGASYTPVAGDDGVVLTVTVTATNSNGSDSATSAGVTAVYAAPTAAAALADQSFAETTGVQTVAAAGDFTGGGLVFSLVSPPTGVTVASGTGVLSVDTDATGALSAVSVVVRATNSGGQADSAFSLTVAQYAASAYGAPGGAEPTLVVDMENGYFRENQSEKTSLHEIFDNTGATTPIDMATLIDTDGKLKWPLHNLYPGGTSVATNQTVTMAAGVAHTVAFRGTGSVTFSGGHTGTLNGTGVSDLVTASFTPSGNVTCSVTGSVTEIRAYRSDLAGMQALGPVSDPTYLAAAAGPCFTFGCHHGTGGVTVGLPLFGARQNIMPADAVNENWGNMWNDTPSANGSTPQALDMLGVFQGRRIPSGGATWHRIDTGDMLSFTAGQKVSITAVYQPGTSATAYFMIREQGNESHVSGAHGALSATQSGVGEITAITQETLADGSILLSFVWTPSLTSSAFELGFGPYTTMVGDYVDLGYVQVEIADAPGPIIPNLDGVSTLTRAEARAEVAATDIAFGTTEGTVFASFLTRYGAAQANRPRLWQADGGDETSHRALILDPPSGAMVAESHDGGVNQITGLSAAYVDGAAGAAAFTYAADDFALSLNGAAGMIDQSGSLGAGITTFRLGGASGTGHALGGYLKSLVLYPSAVGSGDVAALSGAGLPQPMSAPVNTTAPSVAGDALEGSTLSAVPGVWSGASITFTYQWKRDGVDIAGATGSTYVTVTADVDSEITVAIGAANAFGTASVTTATGVTVTDAASPALPQGLAYHPAKAASAADKIAGFIAPDGYGDLLTNADIYYVDNLNADTSPGSIRAGVENMTNGSLRVVIPRVAGTIPIGSMSLTRDNTWFAGEAAPGKGIELTGNDATVRSSNTMVGHMKFRPGYNTDYNNTDGLAVREPSGGGVTERLKFYNCSVQGSNDESVSVNAIWSPGPSHIRYVSFVDCLFGYPMSNRSNNHIFGPLVLDSGYGIEFARCLMSGFRFRVPSVELGGGATVFSCIAVRSNAGTVSSPFSWIVDPTKSTPEHYDTWLDGAWNLGVWDDPFFVADRAHSGTVPPNHTQVGGTYKLRRWSDGNYVRNDSWTAARVAESASLVGAGDWREDLTAPSWAPNHMGWEAGNGDLEQYLFDYVGAFPAARDDLDVQCIADALAMNLPDITSLPASNMPQITTPDLTHFVAEANPFELVNGVPRVIWQIHDNYHVPAGGIPFL